MDAFAFWMVKLGVPLSLEGLVTSDAEGQGDAAPALQFPSSSPSFQGLPPCKGCQQKGGLVGVGCQGLLAPHG